MRTASILVILTVILLLCSCQVTKRRYQKGFYFSQVHKSNTATVNARKKSQAKVAVKISSAQELNSPGELSAQIDQHQVLSKEAIKTNHFGSNAGDSCDVILFKDGSELRAKVTEVTPTEVKYRRCDNLSGPVYVTMKSDLFMITYANGAKEVIKSEPPNNVSSQQRLPGKPTSYKQLYPNRVTHPASYASAVCAILSVATPYIWTFVSVITGISFPVELFVAIIVLALVALLSGLAAQTQIKREPEIYKGTGLARFGVIMGAVALGIYLFIGLILLFA